MSSPPRPFRPGIAFDSQKGKLYEFTSSQVVVIRPYPNPAAWRRTSRRDWHGLRPRYINLEVADHPNPGNLPRSARCVAQAFALVPHPIRKAAIQGSFRPTQWHSLSLVCRCPGALDLALRTPLVAAALGCSWAFRPRVTQPLRSARRLLARGPLRHQDATICDWLALPTSRAWIRRLRGVLDPHRWFPSDLRRLHELMQGDARKLLLHAGPLRLGALRLISIAHIHKALPAVHVDLIRQMSQDQRVANRTARQMRSILDHWPRLRESRKLPTLRTCQQLAELEGRLSLEDQAGSVLPPALVAALPWPDPPIPEAPGFEAIHGWEEIVREGRVMGHCIGNNVQYVRAVLLGCGYAYRVKVGVHRATLFLSRDGEQVWRISELRGRRNRQPATTLVKASRLWLARYQQQQPPDPTPIRRLIARLEMERRQQLENMEPQDRRQLALFEAQAPPVAGDWRGAFREAELHNDDIPF